MASRRAPARPAPANFYDGTRYVAQDSTGHRLFQLMQAMRREIEARLATHELTDAQWKPLWVLRCSGGGSSARELAERVGMDAGAATRLVDRLARKGFVERTRSATDRRMVQLRLTPAGAAVAEHIPQVLAAVHNDFLAGFSKSEWQQLNALLERMRDNGRQLAADAESA